MNVTIAQPKIFGLDGTKQPRVSAESSQYAEVVARINVLEQRVASLTSRLEALTVPPAPVVAPVEPEPVAAPKKPKKERNATNDTANG